MTASVHLLRESNLLDVPGTLRRIADSIEAGEYGVVGGATVVLDGDGLEVFYAGTGEAAPNAHLLLHAGAAKMMRAVMDGKG